MKPLLFSLFLLIILQNCTDNTSNQPAKPKPETASTIQIADQDSLLRHTVLFKFKDEATAAEVTSIEDAFRELPKHIPEIKAFEWGTNNSPEGLEQGFTHCFLVSFGSEEGRAVYLPHPKHQEFVEILKPLLDKVLVFDYWAKE